MWWTIDVVEPCSEGEQALEHREIVHLFFFLPFLPSTINSPLCPWTRNQADTWAMVGCRPSAQSPSPGAAAGAINHTPVKGSGGLEEQLDKAAFQGMDVRVKDKHSTAATGNNKKTKNRKSTSHIFPFPGSRAQICPVPPTRLFMKSLVSDSSLSSTHEPFFIISLIHLRGGVREWLWWPPGIQPSPPQCPAPHFPAGQHEVGMAQPIRHNSELQRAPLLSDLQAQTHRGDYN